MTLDDLKAPLRLIEDWNPNDATELFLSLNLPDGEILSHEHIAAIIGVPRKLIDFGDDGEVIISHKASDKLNRFKALSSHLLMEHSIYLHNIWGEGYQIIPPADQSAVATAAMMKNVKRAMDNASRIIKYTRVNQLSNIERKNHTDTDLKLKGFEQMVKAHRSGFRNSELDSGDGE